MGTKVQDGIRIGSKAPEFNLPSLLGPVHLSDYAGRKHLLLYFMSRFTSSNYWRALLALGDMRAELQRRDVVVLVIGRGPYLEAASELGESLQLPFTFLNDHDGTISGRFRLPGATSTCVLIDKQGIIRYHQHTFTPRVTLNVIALLTAVYTLGTPYPHSLCTPAGPPGCQRTVAC